MKCWAVENHPNDSRVKLCHDGIVQTLSSRMGTGGNNTPLVLITSTNPDTPSGNHTPSQASGKPEDPAVMAAKESFVMNSSMNGIAGTLDGNYFKGCGQRQGIEREYVMIKAYTAGNGQLDNAVISPKCSTLDCMHDQKMVILEDDSMAKNRKYILRRLTPVECLRLQGLPDWWCDGAKGSDSAIYQMAGNGLAIPCAAFILEGIAEELRKSGKEGNT